MTVTINGTSGITTPGLNSTASNVLGDNVADTLNVGNGAIVTDSSGNVGIGTSSPQKRLHVVGSSGAVASFPAVGGADSLIVENSANSNINLIAAASNSAEVKFTASGGTGVSGSILYNLGTNYMGFGTNFAERMRIDSSGNLLVGTTSPAQTTDGVYIQGRVTATSSAYNFGVRTTAGQTTLLCRDDYYLRSTAVYDRTSGGAANVFIDSSGYIYRSTSSLRYKTDVRDYDKGLQALSTLRPVYYKSNVTDADGNVGGTQFAGLIAEEIAAAGFEEFVVRNSEGQPDAVHYGNMVALCVKAIQELKAELDATKTRLTAAEEQILNLGVK